MMYMSIVGPYLQSQPYDSLSSTDKKILGQIKHLSAGNSVFTNRSNRPPFIVKRMLAVDSEEACNDKCKLVIERGICSATSICVGPDFKAQDSSCDNPGRACFKYNSECTMPCKEESNV